MAMTVVLPAPVASFSARRSSSGLASLLALARCSRKRSAGLAELGRDLGQPDGRLDRLDLAEERADAAELVVPPVLQQARRLRRDAASRSDSAVRATCRPRCRTSLMIGGVVVLLFLGRLPRRTAATPAFAALSASSAWESA